MMSIDLTPEEHDMLFRLVIQELEINAKASAMLHVSDPEIQLWSMESRILRRLMDRLADVLGESV